MGDHRADAVVSGDGQIDRAAAKSIVMRVEKSDDSLTIAQPFPCERRNTALPRGGLGGQARLVTPPPELACAGLFGLWRDTCRSWDRFLRRDGGQNAALVIMVSAPSAVRKVLIRSA